jgi:long-chain acyl-CoA synthetase
VQEISVVGTPHPDWGEIVVAFVITTEGASIDTADLDAFFMDHIASFKRPKVYHFVNSLPKNNTGKILKTELRRMLAKEGKII